VAWEEDRKWRFILSFATALRQALEARGWRAEAQHRQHNASRRAGTSGAAIWPAGIVAPSSAVTTPSLFDSIRRVGMSVLTSRRAVLMR
jgi:hypothetical protein